MVPRSQPDLQINKQHLPSINTMQYLIAISIVIFRGGLYAAAFSNNLDMRVPQTSSSSVTNAIDHNISRRDVFKWGYAALISSTTFAKSEDALAFPNKISSKYDDRPKQRGAMVRCTLHLSEFT
jgi:hypothetical protein